MAYEVNLHQTDPVIFVIRFSGLVDPQEVIAAAHAVRVQAQAMPRPVYQVGDWHDVQSNFANLMGIVRIWLDARHIYAVNRLEYPIIVNSLNNPWLRLSRNLLGGARFGRFKMRVFEDVQEAVKYIHAEHCADASESHLC